MGADMIQIWIKSTGECRELGRAATRQLQGSYCVPPPLHFRHSDLKSLSRNGGRHDSDLDQINWRMPRAWPSGDAAIAGQLLRPAASSFPPFRSKIPESKWGQT